MSWQKAYSHSTRNALRSPLCFDYDADSVKSARLFLAVSFDVLYIILKTRSSFVYKDIIGNIKMDRVYHGRYQD